MRTVRRRIYAAHLTVYRGIIEQLEQVEIDAFPTAFVTKPFYRGGESDLILSSEDNLSFQADRVMRACVPLLPLRT
jgi:hypothetical protein